VVGEKRRSSDPRFPGLAMSFSIRHLICVRFTRTLAGRNVESATAERSLLAWEHMETAESAWLFRDGKFDDAFKTPRIERVTAAASEFSRSETERVTRALGGSARARSAGYQIESSRLSYFPREFSAWRPPAKSSEISRRRSRSSPAISSGKFDTVARSSELAVDD